ncbi:General secretion pathway protein F [Anaerohalosphaera lusitana]|uniref:General secretion pathway protein F n=1 Tax=Anaerohalosphaera lusitana TaxID=1936003 RepID=A0A1U9NNU6_9BACT|nr:type II secretion system F family protein [Anaerohalosphaera lusitana]AQT69569.1 General secretion pathway protein F [Anaerohalosphaera lusitana]
MATLEQTLNQTEDTSQVISTSSAGTDAAQDQPQTTMDKLNSFSIEAGPNRKDILNFTNQLSVMVKAGMSLQESLESIAEQTEKRKFKEVLMDVKNRIEGGQSFSQALAEHDGIFNELYINMVAAAEISGSLSSMLEKLAGYLDQEAETRSQVMGAMMYPIIIGVMAVTCVTFLLIFVLPKFLAVFAGKEQYLPGPTKIIMAISGTMRGYWYVIFPGIAAAIGGFHYFTKTPTGKVWWDKVKLKMPLVKTLCRSLYITRGLHTMGVLTNAGVPVLDTLNITAKISGNIYFKRMWQDVHENVRQGKKIAQSLDGYDLLPSSVVQMLRSGEDSGSLGTVLRDVSEFYGRELKTVIKMVTSMIEPIMIVVMGVIVGFIAMSIILPIFKMSNVVTG